MNVLKKLNLKSSAGKIAGIIKKNTDTDSDSVGETDDKGRKFNLKNNKITKFLSSKKFTVFVIILALLVSLVQVLFAVLIYGFNKEDKVTRAVASIVPFPYVVVNQYVVTYSDYLDEKDYIHHFYQSTQQENIDYAAVDQEIVNHLVENRILDYQAMKYKVKVTDKDVDATLDQIIEQNGGKDKVDKVLGELYGINLKKFRVLVRDQLVREKTGNEVIAKVGVRHILVRVDKNAPEDKVAEAKTKIDGYLNEINGGLDFGEAAKKYSEDIGSAENGGQLEPFAAGEMVEEFSKAAFASSVGKISDPVRTDFGWHIIKVESKTGKVEKTFSDWLEELKKKSLIIRF